MNALSNPSPQPINLPKRYITLIKRELQENRRSMLYAPFAMAGVLFLLVVASSLFNGVFKVNDQTFTIRALAGILQAGGAPAVTKVHAAWLLSFFAIYHAAASIVMFSYALSCLFDERKDRSTLFWRSLPVRDWETVAAKVVMLVFVIPILFMAALLVLQLLLVGLWTVLCWRAGLDTSALVFSTVPFGTAQLWQWSHQFFSSLWLLPILAWCLLCSASAKQRPFLLATLVPGMLTVILSVVNVANVFSAAGGDGPVGFLKTHLYGRLMSAFVPGSSQGSGVKLSAADGHIFRFDELHAAVISTPFWLGLGVALALLAATAYLRRYREDAAV
jgi:ABC-2 type transport system permease protein